LSRPSSSARWKAANESFASAVFQMTSSRSPLEAKRAETFFVKNNLYSIAYRLRTAKTPETKLKRTQAIIEKLARGETFH
jgi:hypothetical protein